MPVFVDDFTYVFACISVPLRVPTADNALYVVQQKTPSPCCIAIEHIRTQFRVAATRHPHAPQKNEKQIV